MSDYQLKPNLDIAPKYLEPRKQHPKWAAVDNYTVLIDFLRPEELPVLDLPTLHVVSTIQEETFFC